MLASRTLSRCSGALAAFLFMTASAIATPAVTVSPGAGPPTTTITVSGTGFGVTQLIDVYFDAFDYCVTASNASGGFSCAFKVPYYIQPQTHWITAAQRSNGLAAQKAFIVRTDWPQFHGMNAKHTGFNPYENTIDSFNASDLDILWMAPIGPSGNISTPVVVGGRVYIGGLNDRLFAFSNKNGASIAGFPKILGGPATGSPAVGANIVYIGTGAPAHKLYAFNATTGAIIAGFPVTLGSEIFASPTLFGGNVYVACFDGKIYAFNAVTATPVSGFPITVGGGTALDATVSAANGRIFEGSEDHNFYAFDAKTGALIAGFPKSIGDKVESTAAIDSGQVFFGSDDDNLYGVRRYDGTDLSGFPVSTTGEIIGSPAIGDNGEEGSNVFVGSTDHKIYAYDPTSGADRSGGGVLLDDVVGSPVVANGVLYVNTVKSLYALDDYGFTIVWRASVPTSVYASPVVADGIVYIASTDGNLYAFSVNGVFPASRLPGGELGVRPAISSLKPDYSLRAAH